MDNNEMNQSVETATEVAEANSKKDKKPATFGKGMIIGIISGMILAAIIFVVTINIYQNKTGFPLLLSKGGIQIYTNTTAIDEATAVKVDEIMKAIDYYYDGDIDADSIRNEILHAVVDGLGDKYASYMTPEEYKAFNESTSGVFYGIGAQLQKDETTGAVKITKVFKNSPAEEAGLLAEDLIVSADGYQAVDMDLTSFVNKIKGDEGTSVKLEIYRSSTDEIFEVTATRRQIDSPSVDSCLLENGIGYIQISEFQTNTPKQFEEAYQALEDQGVDKLVIDLRDNPGGLLSAVTELADYILPSGTIVSVTNKYGTTNKYTSDKRCINADIVVLINGNSASASEILAGAIKDYGYGTLLGTTTFGKGIVQSIYGLSDGDAIKITTAKYYTPNGNYIHGTGIEPDVELEYEKQTSYTKEGDNQLQKAIEILKSK